MTGELPLRARVLAHIELHSEGGRWGVRVPDDWIDEANASVEDGQSVRGRDGRRLTEKGRSDLAAMTGSAG